MNLVSHRSLMLCSLAIGAIFAVLASSVIANDERLAVDESFPGKGLAPEWRVQTGAWEIREGALHGAEIEADNHSAAARYIVETTNAIYEMKFRLTKNGKAMHFGFDPARGELKKRGHLFSVIVTPSQWTILKHVDKDRPKEDPNEKLAIGQHEFVPGQWYHLRVTTNGTQVTAEIESVGILTADHPTFAVKKPTLVFRALGDGVGIDDLKVRDYTP